MLRLAVLSGIAAILIASIPSGQSALAQTCAPRSPIISARASIPVSSSLPDCDGRGRPLPEGPVSAYVSPLDPDYGIRIAHGATTVQAEPISPSGASGS
jgi:hypothetical protein